MTGAAWWWAGAAVLVLVAVDRAVARWWRPRVRRPSQPTSGGSSSVGLGAVFEVFAPGMVHLHAEQERQRNDLVEVGDTDPPWDLDLDAGVVRLDPPGAAARVQGAPVLSPLTRDVWTATAARWSTVTTVVVAGDGACLVVDPGITVAEVTLLAGELAERGWRPVAGFSTHPHWDHLLWSDALGDGPRWATATAARVAAEQHARLTGQAEVEAPGHRPSLIGAVTPLPDRDEPAELPWLGPRAVVVPYAGHCAGSAALVLPDSGVLVAGDMLSDLEIPLLDEAAADPLGDYREALDRLEAAAAEHQVRWVVAGHGHPGDRTAMRRRLAADRAYLDALEAGRPVDDPRLADPEQAAAHAQQVQLAGQLRTRGGSPSTSWSRSTDAAAGPDAGEEV